MGSDIPRGLDVAAWRAQLPITRRCSYLNNAATSPTPLFVNEAVAEHYRQRSDLADVWFDRWVEAVDAARGPVGRLVGMPPASVAFTKNTGDAIGIVATALDWEKGDNVVVSDREFPTNFAPWARLARFGVELRVVSSREPVVPEAEWERAIDGRTRIVACSLVEYATGVRNDVARLARLAHAKGAWLLVDAIQGLGAVPLPEGPDLVACGGHKWLMAPYGVGFLAVRPGLVGRIVPAAPGWFSYEDPEDHGLGDRPLARTARRFEPGNLNFSGIAGLAAAASALPPARESERRLAELTQPLVDGLAARGLPVPTPEEPGRRAGIVCFAHGDPKALVARAEKAGVMLAARAGRVRLSPHFWNTEDEVRKALDACR